MLAAAAGTSQPVVAALFGLGASALAGAVVAMAWSVHARQIRLAELLVRRQFILTREPAAPEESLNGYAGLEADRLQEALEAVGAREAQAGQTREAQTREAQTREAQTREAQDPGGPGWPERSRKPRRPRRERRPPGPGSRGAQAREAGHRGPGDRRRRRAGLLPRPAVRRRDGGDLGRGRRLSVAGSRPDPS